MSNPVQRQAIVVLGGGDPPRSVLDALPRDAFVVAADSGADHAFALDLRPHVIVGDLDSISPRGRRDGRDAGVPFATYPTDKDATDGELALAAAVDHGARTITLVTGGHIDRLDHLLAVIALLTSPATDAIRIMAFVGRTQLQRARRGEPTEIACPAGHTVTLLPLFGTVGGVTTTGLRWPLTNDELPLGTTRGVSNIVTGTPARVSVESGTLLVISPEALS